MKVILRHGMYIFLLIMVLTGCEKGKSLVVEKVEKDQNTTDSGMRFQQKDAVLSPNDIIKADYTIEECYSLKQDLNAKTIKVRGKVVKYNPKIMNKNWIHIQDGTGGDDSFDLTITSKDETSVGKIILVSGKIMYDQSYGKGLDYPVIMTEAKIIEEK